MLSNQQINQIYEINQIHYRTISQKIALQPKQDQKCTDSFFILLFIITLAIFFGIGIYSIVELKSNNSEQSLLTESKEEFSIINQAGIILIGVGSSIFIGMSIVILIKVLDRAAIFFIALVSLLSIGSSSIVGFILSNVALGVSMGILFMIYLFLIMKMKKKIDIGIVFIKTSGYFLNENRFIFLLPILKLIAISLITFFFVESMNNLGGLIEIKSQKGMSKILQQILLLIQLVILLVLIFVFYYFMAYLISSLSVNWYYGTQGIKSISKSYVSMFRQTGTLFFASLIILLLPFIKIILFTRKQIDRKTNSNHPIQKAHQTSIVSIISKFLQCFLACLVSTSMCFIRLFLQHVQGILKVLNHYTIIMVSLTGEDYLSAAKSVVGLTHRQFDLMEVNNTICNYIITWGLSLTVGVPSIIAYFLMEDQEGVTENQQFYTTLVVGACCTMVSIIFLEIMIVSISSIYILYAFDKDLVERNLVKCERLEKQRYYEINRCSKNPYITESQAIQICKGDYYALNE